METARAYKRPRRTKLVAATAARGAEIVVGAVVTILFFQTVLRFSLFDPVLWTVYGPIFVAGLRGTLGFILLVIPISLVLGFFLGWARISRHRVLVWPVTMFIDFFRGMPPLVLVIFAFLFGDSFVPEVIRDRLFAGIPLRTISVTAAAVAIALHSAAYQAEIFRAGFQSVPKGQLEAAQALGMRPWQAMRHVVLPQTFRLSLPPLGNELAVVIKDTSLLAAVAGRELVSLSQNFAGTLSISGFPVDWLFAIWTAVAIAYFAATFSLTRLLLALERRVHTPGLEATSI
jgi:His/Glu/Gln/Arg/opine family amino acid ABC transporter permease subunit